MKDLKHIFLDLDRTLWDFETNSHEELINLYHSHHLHQRGISLPEEFIKIYKQINEDCWERYRNNKLSKEKLRGERFYLSLNYFGIDNLNLANKIGEDYVKNSPYRTKVISGTFELLDHLSKNYNLHIITNGFEEVQHIKLKESGLAKYFEQVITSEEAGAKKPAKKVFEFALMKSSARVEESVMVGDDLKTDIEGAIDIGMKSIYFNPNGKVHEYDVWKEVKKLSEIKNILL